jgi:hypothetical protein
MKEIKIKADILVKLPDDCTDVDLTILELEVALNTNWQTAIRLSNMDYAKRMGVRFHFKEREKEKKKTQH